MRTIETLKQQLLNGLKGAEYEKYVDLVAENLQEILRDNDYAWELYFVENNNETLWDTVESMMADWGAQDFINYVQNSDFDPYEDFMAYNSFETKSYEELRDLYVKELFSDYYADILTELVLLEEVSFELFEALEKSDTTQMIRNQIVDLLDADDSEEVILALLPVLETNSEYDYYLPHDKDSLEYVFRNVFRNDLTAFTNWVTSDDYSKSSYLNIIDSYQIVCVNSLEVYEDLRCYVQNCSDEVLDEMIAILDELEL